MIGRQLRTALRRSVRDQQRQSRRLISWFRGRSTLRTRRALVVACVSLILAGLFVTQCSRRNQQPEEEEIQETDLLTLKVMRVIDGDTFEVFYDDEPTSVRIHGIDAPEKADIGGRESTEALRRILGDSEVTLIFPEARKRDSFGRLLAIVYVNDTNVGKWLINNGFARKYQR